jgi:heat shock protein HtpX
MIKRVSLFILTNFIVILTLSFFSSIFHIQPYLHKHGLNYGSLLVFCLIWGFGGSFISLLLSRFTAKKLMGVEIINPNIADPEYQALLKLIHDLSKKAGIKKMPQVGIYPSEEINAFATGPTKNRALIALSVGLLKRMNTDQIIGVVAHEISHIANGDMITLTLIQGVVNSFILFFARIVAYLITQNAREEFKRIINYSLILVFEIIFRLFGTIVVAAFSRHREFRADAGGAKLVGSDKMISVLNALKYQSNITHNKIDSPNLAAFKIYGKNGNIFSFLFATHPSLDSRIDRLVNTKLH